MTTPEMKYGIVILLDALGASSFSESKIREFLSCRSEVNKVIQELASDINARAPFPTPEIFTFGDTVIITIQLNDPESRKVHIGGTLIILRRYLYHSMESGILFRGAFSIGNYIADDQSNTVMGDAISDAASWYEEADWAGVCATPKAKNVIQHISAEEEPFAESLIETYEVPLKSGHRISLPVVPWFECFWHKELADKPEDHNPRRHFYSLLSEMEIPKGTERKYENTIHYFDHIAKRHGD